MYDVAIVDGNNVFFKGFSVHKDFFVKVGDQKIYTGGTFGFLNSLITLKNDYLNEDGEIIVAWDRGYVKRTAMYPEYKANRNKDEWEDYENFKEQLLTCQNVLKMLGIRQAYKAGEEADDICGALSKSRQDRGQSVIIMSADKDYQQLIDHGIDLLAHKGKDNIKVWTKKSWEKANGISTIDFIYVLALMGDKGDNIPGVPGIGEKGAYKMIQENLHVLQAIESEATSDWSNLWNGKENAAIKKMNDPVNAELFRISYRLAKIDRDLKGIKIHKGRKDMEALEDLFEMYKFNKFLQKSNWKVLETL
jgi:DNA polymerase I